jgi:very-short-patch-repair endonuclease
MNLEGRKKISEAIKRKWENDHEYRNKMSDIVFSDEEKARRSKWLKEKNQDLKFREKLFLSSKNRLSKLHQKIREELNLDDLGFISEQRVLKYFVDELNEEKKLIVEIYGDYPHANPKKYSEDFIVRLYGQSFTASEKREQDLFRKNKLEEAGYTVIVVWESDDMEEKKKQIISFYT